MSFENVQLLQSYLLNNLDILKGKEYMNFDQYIIFEYLIFLLDLFLNI